MIASPCVPTGTVCLRPPRRVPSPAASTTRCTARLRRAALHGRLDALERRFHALLEVGLAVLDSHDVLLEEGDDSWLVVQHLERLGDLRSPGIRLEAIGPLREVLTARLCRERELRALVGRVHT